MKVDYQNHLSGARNLPPDLASIEVFLIALIALIA